jgi:hypothetical protein
MYLVSIIAIGLTVNLFYAREGELTFNIIALTAWIGVNLAWSSPLNPAFRHTFKPWIKWEMVNQYLYQTEYKGYVHYVKCQWDDTGLIWWSFVYDNGVHLDFRNDTMIQAVLTANEKITEIYDNN